MMPTGERERRVPFGAVPAPEPPPVSGDCEYCRFAAGAAIVQLLFSEMACRSG
jgi:hypothetical protein